MLKDKNIIIISPQPWGKMMLSKHYYALELARKNNQVYFLSPTKNRGNGKILILPSDIHPNLLFVQFNFLIPYFFKFKWPWLFQQAMNLQASRISKKIGRTIDIIWDFDCNYLFKSNRFFRAKTIVFHPVDQGEKAPNQKKPDILFSVSPIILESHQHFKAPAYFINHGLGKAFVSLAQKELQKLPDIKGSETSFPKNIGYVGNLKHPAIDRVVLEKIVKSLPQVAFHFIGPFKINEQEKGDQGLVNFITFLENAPNVYLYGIKSQEEIIRDHQNIDIYIAVYKRSANYNADNSHKIMEYLSTGKVVVSNYLSVYDGSDLFVMARQDLKDDFITQLNHAMANWQKLNQKEEKEKRLRFALNNTYKKQLERIEDKLVLHQLI